MEPRIRSGEEPMQKPGTRRKKYNWDDLAEPRQVGDKTVYSYMLIPGKRPEQFSGSIARFYERCPGRRLKSVMVRRKSDRKITGTKVYRVK